MRFNIRFLLLPILALTMAACHVQDPTKTGLLVAPTVDENPDLPSLDLNGSLFHAWAVGEVDSPVVVLLHGGPGSDITALSKWASLTEEGYRVVLWDQRGSGLSRRHDANVMTEEVFLEDLRQLILHYSPNSPVILLGHSWGAMYATMLVNSYPDLVRGMILSEPGGLTVEQMLTYVQATQSLEPTSEWTNDLVWGEQIFSPSQKFFSEEDHNLYDYQYSIGAGLALEGSFGTDSQTEDWYYPIRRFGAVTSVFLPRSAPNFDWTTHLDQFNKPVLFLYSSQNPAYTAEHVQVVTAPFQQIEVHQVMGVGHELMYSGYDLVFPLVKTYLTELQ